MKKIHLICTLLFSVFIHLNAQTTAIPDSRFEQKLIALGYDDVPDHSVLTANISGVTTLDIVGLQNQEIYDLTGIEDFASLQILYCNLNKLSTLDLSNNTNLVTVNCSQNMLTSLDVSGCLNLDWLVVDLNFLPELDLSANTNLTYLKCFSNSLSSLDLSLNTALYYVRCSANPLTELNVQNGNNANMTNFDARNNPLLTCIQVDDEDLANAGSAPYTYPNWRKDDIATYSEDCTNLSVDDAHLANAITVYPNPAHAFISISSEIIAIEDIEIYSITGKHVKTVTHNFEYVPISNLAKGVYIVKIMAEHQTMLKKIIIE